MHYLHTVAYTWGEGKKKLIVELVDEYVARLKGLVKCYEHEWTEVAEDLVTCYILGYGFEY